MKTRNSFLAAAVALSVFLAMSASAAVRYVDVNSVSPSPPFTNWATAATIIQDAVDAAMAGDEIVVTNGVYQTGGRAVYGTMTNRVAVDKPLTLRSVNGPEVTVIREYQVPGTTNRDGAVRCVYLANGAALVGFTLTNGATRSLGDYEREQTGGGVWCESSSAAVSNCVLTGNSAGSGGGAFYGTLNDCTFSGNSAEHLGGGAFCGTLNNCTLIGNTAYSGGGGTYESTLNNCTLTGNLANGEHSSGGGAYYSMLNNCMLTGNSASSDGGGAFGGTLNNCTLTGNSADSGGGASGGAEGPVIELNNCIVYYNVARSSGANYYIAILNYCCTAPPLPSGVGNVVAEPELASASHLSAGSPCRGAGNPAYSIDVDIDDEPWNNPPSIGCDEPYTGIQNGPLTVAIEASFTNVATGFKLRFVAQIIGNVSESRWEFGDGTVVSNRPYAAHSWSALGDFSVVLRAFNASFPDGVSATVTVHVVSQPVHYVAAGSSNPVSPYSSWLAAATNVQDAVDAVSTVGALVLVSNGVYQFGGRAGSLVVVDKPLTLRSVKGPEATVLNGRDAGRCVHLASGAALEGFTLTQGHAAIGAGIWCESTDALVSNCVLTGNQVSGINAFGGGAFGGTFHNCIIINNSTYSRFVSFGGGAYDSKLNNCIVYFNSASGSFARGGDNAVGCLNYCCTTPLPSNGVGNFTNTPLFVDQASGNLRLQSNSPCINAGRNAYAPNAFDLDGNPRIVGGTVDVGAYEFQSPQSAISYAWLQGYGLPTDGSADFTDGDGDGLNNWQEWRCLTDPTNALSVLRLLSPASSVPGVSVRWQSVRGRNYFLERGTNLGAQPPFLPLATDIVGQPGTTIYLDTNAVGAGPFFYRVGVQP